MNPAPDPLSASYPAPHGAAGKTRSGAAQHWRHLLPVITLSLVAHVLVLGSLPDFRPAPSAAAEPLHATLVLSPPAAMPTPAAAPPPAPAPRRSAPRDTPKPAPVAVVAEVTAPPPVLPASPGREVQAPAPQPVAAVPVRALPAAPVEVFTPVAASPVITPASTAPPPPAPLPAAAPTPPPAAPRPKAQPPAPARLRYEVIATDTRASPPTRTYGKGNVSWSQENGRYKLDLLASVDLLFFSLDVLASHSEGLLDEHGLAPLRYSETPRRRPAVATNFNRDAGNPLTGTITFSAATNSYPLVPSAQDRLSVIFQLAGMLRANPALGNTGQQITLFVAGVRGDAEPWTFHVLGRDTVQTDKNPIDTVRLQRVAKSGSNDRTVDLWYTLDQGGYPAQIRYTETNGNRIELLLAGTE